MPEYKKQHYVPQFYLRNFSNDGKHVYVYNIDHKKSFPTKIKNICQESYFNCDTPEFEQITSKIEDKQAVIIAKIIEESNLTFLETEELFYLHLFVLMQSTRTIESRNFVDGFINSILDGIKPLMKRSKDLKEKGVKPEHIDSLKIKVEKSHLMIMTPAMMGAELIIDLLPIIIINQTDKNFIISDAPVCLHNYIKSNNHGMLGFQSPGLQIYVPLNEKMLLLFIDREFYDFHLYENNILHVEKSSDVDSINKLQIFNCVENLIHSKENDEDYLKQLHSEIQDNLEKSRIKSILVSKKVLEDDKCSEIRNTYRTIPDYSLKLSFLN